MNKKENKKNNIEEVTGGNMNIISRLVMGIKGYFKENYSDHIFRKTVSMLVVMCFVLNIANLPAFAGQKKSRHERQQAQQEMKSEAESGGVSYRGDETSGTVSYMQSLSENIEVKDGVIFKKGKNGKNEPIGYWDGEKAMLTDGEGKLRENATYTEAVKRKNSGESKKVSVREDGENVSESEIVEQKKYGEQEAISAEKKEKSAQEISEAKGTVIGEYKQEAKKENVTDIEKAKEAEKTEQEVKVAEEQEESNKEINSYRDSQDYKEVVNKLSEDTGLSEEEIEAQLAGVPDDKLEEAIGVLKGFYADQNATIINCATEALSAVLNMSMKGVLALQALLVDIATGVFGAKSIQNIDGKTQLMTSMNAMNKVLEMYGVKAGGYEAGLTDFVNNLGVGESGIIWVNGDHYITVTNKGDGKFSINDGGKEMEYSESGLKSELSKKYNINGNDKITVLTNGKNMETVGDKLSEERMKEVLGAKYVTVKETVRETVSVTVEYTVMVDKTRQEARTGTSSYTDSKGVTHSYTYTYYVTIHYKEPEKKTKKVQKTVTKTVEKQKWVDDPSDKKQPTDAEKKKVEAENKKKEEEARKAAAEEARKAAEEAARKAAEADKKAAEAAATAANEQDKQQQQEQNAEIVKKGTEDEIKVTSIDVNGKNVYKAGETADPTNKSEDMTDEDFKQAVENGDIYATEATVVGVVIDGQEVEIKDGQTLDDVLNDYKKVAEASAGIADSKVAVVDNQFQLVVGTNAFGKDNAQTYSASDIGDDVAGFVDGANKALSVVNGIKNGDSKAEVGASYNKDTGWSVNTPSGNVSVSDISDTQTFIKDYKTATSTTGKIEGATAEFKDGNWNVNLPNGQSVAASDISNVNTFANQYNAATAITAGINGEDGTDATMSYDKDSGWQVTTGGQTINVSAIGTTQQEINNFVNGYNAATAITAGINGDNGTDATASYDGSQGWQVTAGGQTVKVSDIGTSEDKINAFVDGYNKSKDIAAGINGENGTDVTTSYDKKEGWRVTVGNQTIKMSDISGSAEDFVKDYQTARDSVKDLGEGVRTSFNYDKNQGWQVTVNDQKFNVSDINELGITFGKNEEGKTTVSVGGQTAVLANLVGGVQGFVNNYRKGLDIATQTGLPLTYKEGSGWQLTYKKGEEDKTINVSKINDKENFIAQYNNAKAISDGTGLNINFNGSDWQVIYNNGKNDTSINITADIDTEKFVNEYNAMKNAVAALEGTEGLNIGYKYTKDGWSLTLNNTEIAASGVNDYDITFKYKQGEDGTQELVAMLSTGEDGKEIEVSLTDPKAQEYIGTYVDIMSHNSNPDVKDEDKYDLANGGLELLRLCNNLSNHGVALDTEGLASAANIYMQNRDALNEFIGNDNIEGLIYSTLLNAAGGDENQVKVLMGLYMFDQASQLVNNRGWDLTNFINEKQTLIGNYLNVALGLANGTKTEEDYEAAVAALNSGFADVELDMRPDGDREIWTGIKNFIGIQDYAAKNNYKVSYNDEGQVKIMDSEGKTLFDASIPLTYAAQTPDCALNPDGTETDVARIETVIGNLSAAQIQQYMNLRNSGATEEQLSNYLASINGFKERVATNSEGEVVYRDTPLKGTQNYGNTGVFDRTFYGENGAEVEKKLYIQGYGSDYTTSTEQVFKHNGGETGQKITLGNGTTFYTDNLILEKAIGWTYGQDDKGLPTRTQSFILFNDAGKPYYIQSGTYGADGYERNLELSKFIPEDALLEQAPTGGSGGSNDNTNPLQIFKDIYTNIGNRKISTVNDNYQSGKNGYGRDIYDGFKYFDKGKIDLSKCITFDGSTGYGTGTEVIGGQEVLVTIVLPNFKFSDDYDMSKSHYTYSSGDDILIGKFTVDGKDSATFSTKSGVETSEGFRYFNDESTNHLQTKDTAGQTSDIEHVNVNYETGEIAYLSGVSTVYVNGGEVTALLGAPNSTDVFSMAMDGVYTVFGNITGDGINLLADTSTGIAMWLLDVKEDSVTYGSGILATNTGVSVNKEAGAFIIDKEAAEEAIQEQRDRLALMNDLTVDSKIRSDAMEAFYNNIPNNYKDYLEKVGITNSQDFAAKAQVTDAGLYIPDCIVPTEREIGYIPSKLGDNDLSANADLSQIKLGLLMSFDGAMFLRIPEFTLTGEATQINGCLDIGIRVSLSGDAHATGMVNFVSEDKNGKYSEASGPSLSVDVPINTETSDSKDGEEQTTKTTDSNQRATYTHGKVISNENGTIITADDDGRLVLTFVSNGNGDYESIIFGIGSEFVAGSDIAGLGQVTSGVLTIIGIDADGNFTYAAKKGTEKCVVENRGINNKYKYDDGKYATVDEVTTYNEYGVSSVVATNNETNSKLTQTYQWSDGILIGVDTNLIVFGLNGNSGPIDTGLGFIIDSKNTWNDQVVLNISTDGTVQATEGAVISYRSLESENGDILYTTYTGTGFALEAKATVEYSVKMKGQDEKIRLQEVQLQDGKELYGVYGDDQLIRCSITGNGKFIVDIIDAEKQEDGSYKFYEEGATSKQNLVFKIGAGGLLDISVELLEVKIEGNWHKPGEEVAIKGMGTYTVSVTNVDGVARWQLDYVETEGVEPPSVDVTFSDGLDPQKVSITSPLLIGYDAYGNMYFETKDNNSFDYNGTNVYIDKGSKMVFDSESGNLVITDGRLRVDSEIIVPKAVEQATDGENTDGSGASSSKGYPEAYGTNAVVEEQEDGSYKVSKGTIQITNGALVILGIGATFQEGSFVLGQKVESGSITVATTREVPDGKGGTQTVPVFICKDGTAKVDMNGITLRYNKNGIYSARQYLGSRTENVDTGSSVDEVTYSSYEIFETETCEGGYRVLSYDYDGNLKHHTEEVKTSTKTVLSGFDYKWYNTVNDWVDRGILTTDQVSNFTYYKTCVAKVAGINSQNVTSLGYSSVWDFAKNATISTDGQGTYTLTATQTCTNGYIDLLNSQIGTYDENGNLVAGHKIDFSENMQATTVVTYKPSTNETSLQHKLTGNFDTPYTLGDGTTGTLTGGISGYSVDDKGNSQQGYMFNVVFDFAQSINEYGVLSIENTLSMTNMDFAYKGSFTTKDPAAGGASGEGGEPSTVYSQGVYDQTEKGFTTISSKGDGYAIISMRNGAYSALGEGAIAFDGSQLQSAGGITTLNGSAVYSAGTWTAMKDTDSYFTFNDSTSVLTNLQNLYEEAGFNVDMDSMKQLNIDKVSAISTDVFSMTSAILKSQSEPTQGINATTTKEASCPDGTVLGAGSKVNMNIVKVDVDGESIDILGFKALGTINATVDLPEGWTLSDASKISAEFNVGEYISFGAVLTKNNPNAILVGKNISWLGKEKIEEVNVKVNCDSSTGYYYFTLVGNGSSYTDPETNEVYNKTNLVTKYNGTDVIVLEGSRVSISKEGISVLNGNIYVDKMHVGINEQSDESKDKEEPAKSPSDSDPYFKGVASGVDSNGNPLTENSKASDLAGWDVTGVFSNYSDNIGMENIFTQSVIFANNSSLYSGSWDYQYGYIKGAALDIKIEIIDGESVRLVTSKGNTTATMVLDSKSKMVTEFDGNGISKAYQETKGSVSGTLITYFGTKKVSGCNIMDIDKDGQYVTTKMVGNNFVDETEIARTDDNERIVERKTLDGEIVFVNGKMPETVPESYTDGLKFYDDDKHKEGTDVSTWETGTDDDGNPVYTYVINDIVDENGNVTNVRAFEIKDKKLLEIKNNKDLGELDVLNSGTMLFRFEYNEGSSKIVADGEIIKVATDGKQYTIGYDSSKGGLYLIGDYGKTNKVMSVDESIYESELYNTETLRMSQFSNYDDYLQQQVYLSGAGPESLDKNTVNAYIADNIAKKGENSIYWNKSEGRAMTYEEFLKDNSIMTADQFNEAKANHQKFAIYIDEEDRMYETDTVLSDIVFKDSFDNGMGGTSEYQYRIMGSSIDSNGLNIKARMMLEGNQQIVLGCNMNNGPEGGSGTDKGSSNTEVNYVTTQVTAEINSDAGNSRGTVKLSGDGAQFDIEFNASQKVSEDGNPTPYKANFSQFIAGTELTIVDSKFNTSSTQDLTNRQIDQEITVGYDVDVDGKITVFCSNNTSITGLGTLILQRMEEKAQWGSDHPLTGDGNVTIKRTLTDSNSNVVTTNYSYDGKNFTVGDTTCKDVNGMAVTNFAGGTFKSGKTWYGADYDKIDFGFWAGSVDTNASNVKISKNFIAGALQTIGGFGLSIVGVLTLDFIGNGTTGLLRESASMMFDKQISDVTASDITKAAISGLVAIAAIVVTVFTGGMGIAAFIPALGGTAAGIGAVVSTSIAVAFSSVGSFVSLISSAVVTAYFASQAAMNAYDAIQNGDYWSAFTNIAAGMISIAFPVRIGSAAKTTSFALQCGSKSIAQARAAINVMKSAESLEKASAAFESMDALSKIDDCAEMKNLTNAIEAATSKGLKSDVIEIALNKFGLSKEAIKEVVSGRLSAAASSGTQTAAQVAGNATKIPFSTKLLNFGKGILGNGGIVNPVTGLVESQTGIIGALQNIRTLAFGGGLGVNAWAGALQNLSSHMFSMFELNVAMNTIGAIGGDALVYWSSKISKTDIPILSSLQSFLGDSFKDIQANGQQGILAVNPGQSLQFGAIMFVGMPIAKSFVGGIKDLFNFGIKDSISASLQSKLSLDKFTSKIQAITKNKFFSATKTILGGAYEEWFEENFKQKFLINPLLQMMGVDAETASQLSEVLVEFMDPDSAGIQYTMENYTRSVSNAKYSQNTINRSVNEMNNVLALNGLDISVSIVNSNTSSSGGSIIKIGNQNFTVENTAQLQNLMLSVGAVAMNSSNSQSFIDNIETINNSLNTVGADYSSRQKVQNNMLAYSIVANNTGINTQDSFNEAYKTASKVVGRYNGLNKGYFSALWDNFKTGKVSSLNTQQKVGILSVAAKYANENDGSFDATNIIEAINSNDTAKSREAFNALSSMVMLDSIGLLQMSENAPFNSSDTVQIINQIKINNLNSLNEILYLSSFLSNGNMNLILDRVNKEVKSLEDLVKLINENNDTNNSNLLNLISEFINNANTNEDELKEVLEKYIDGIVKSSNNEKTSDSDKRDSAKLELSVQIAEITALANYVQKFSEFSKTKENIHQLNINDIFNSDAINKLNMLAEFAKPQPKISKEKAIDIQKTIEIAIENGEYETINKELKGENGTFVALNLLMNRYLVAKGFINNAGLQQIINDILEGREIGEEGYIETLDSKENKDKGIRINKESFMSKFDYKALAKSVVAAVDMLEKDFKAYKNWDYKTEGKSLGQYGALLSVLCGANQGIYAEVGFGKTFIADSIALARSYIGFADMDLIVQNDSELNNHMKNKAFMERNGARVYVMGDIVNMAQNNPNAIVDFNGKKMTAIERYKEVMNDKNGIRIWLDSQYGFGRTTAERNATEQDTQLKDIQREHQKREGRLTIADEVHKFMETTMSYVMSDGSNSTLEIEYNQTQKDAMKKLYKIATTLAEGKDYYIDYVNGQVSFTDEGMKKVKEQINGIEAATTDKVRSMVQAITEYSAGRKYMLTNDTSLVGEDAKGKLVTKGTTAQAEPSMILSDYNYVYAASIQSLTNSNEQDLKCSEEVAMDKAFDCVRVSVTTYGTSRSGLFYGKGQYVGMSGTLSHVTTLSDVYGMTVTRFGTEKNFEFGERDIDSAKERLEKQLENARADLELAENSQGVLQQKLFDVANKKVNDLTAAIEILNEATIGGEIIDNLGHRLQELKELKEQYKDSRNEEILDKISEELHRVQLAYEAYNTISIEGFTKDNGMITEQGTISDKGISKIAEDILSGADKYNMNQLFTSLDQGTLNRVKSEIIKIASKNGYTISTENGKEILQKGNTIIELLEINGTTKADDIYKKVNDKDTGYIIAEEGKIKIILGNERSGMGLDFKGNWQMSADTTEAVYSFMHQDFGRVGRNEGELFSRKVYANMEEVNMLMGDITTSEIFEWLQNEFIKNEEYSKYGIFDQIQSVEDIENLSDSQKLQLAKMYKGFVQSSSSLVFGMIDTLNDKCVTSAIAELISTEGVSLADMQIIKNIQKELFDNHTDGEAGIGRGTLLSGKDQITNSIEGQREKAIMIFSQIVNSVTPGSQVQKKAQEWLNAWQNAQFEEQSSVASEKESIVSLEAKVSSIQKAFNIIYGKASQIIPYFGGASNGQQMTKVQLQQELESRGIANSEEAIELLNNGSYVFNGNLTKDGLKTVQAFLRLSDDDDLAKALMALLISIFGDKLVDGGSSSKNNLQMAQWLTKNNIALDNLIELKEYASAYNVDLKSLGESKVMDILKAKLDQAVVNTMTQQGLKNVPGAVFVKILELGEKEKIKGLESLYDNNILDTIQKTAKMIYNRPLTSKEKIYFKLKEFISEHQVGFNRLGKTSKFANFVAGTAKYMLLKAPFVSLLSNAFGAQTIAQPSWKVSSIQAALPQALAVMTSSILGDLGMTVINSIKGKISSGKNKDDSKVKLSTLGKTLALTMDAVNKVRNIMDAISLKKDISKLNKLLNPKLSEVLDANLDSDSIRAKMAMAGMDITESTDAAISNLEWIKENKGDVYSRMTLSDIPALEELSGLIELAKSNNQYDLALDYDMLQQIKDNKTSLLKLYAPDLAYELAKNIVPEGIASQVVENISNRVKATDVTIEQLAKAIESTDSDADYIMAIIFPEMKDNGKILERYNKLKDKGIAKYVKVGDLSKDSNFVKDGDKISLSDDFAKPLISQLTYGELSKAQIRVLSGNNIANNNAERLVKKLGASKEAEMFVEGLTIESLLDEGFVKDIMKAVGDKEYRNGLGINMRSIYENKELAEQINSIYVEGKEKGQKYREAALISAIANLADNKVKAIMEETGLNKLSAEQAVVAEQLLGYVVTGVTKPQELNDAVSAVLALCENTDAMAKLLGFNGKGEIKSVEMIISKYNEKAGEIIAMEDISNDDRKVALQILSVTRDMLILANQNTEFEKLLDNKDTTINDILPKLAMSKAVNRNVIVKQVTKTIGISKDDEDFVIDVTKLQKAVTEKITVTAENQLKDLGALLNIGRGAAKDKMPIALMKLSDIHAVAAAA